ncbi:endonuclease V [Solihabitans fulvus]|uniref:Endonuclease V n=1 Tax=Solihabitans fulvus TaxID=1892852 RepID=A0A5B2XMR4_9PSEU|nr:endonuclease V [Solihabitans fulvus]KAA2264209.1 endonuclease V [Solihabitans fulvus]
MRVTVPHEWPHSVDEAAAIQERLRPLVRAADLGTGPIRTVAGLDVSYAEGSDRLAAAVVVLDADTLAVVEQVVAFGEAVFPYVPGLFAFRELPPLVEALEMLTTLPDLVVCDGQGVAHPRRFGLACHVGVVTGLPSIGIGKTAMNPFEAPGQERGASSPLVDNGEEVGRVLRTQDGIRPVFVSVGHGLDLAEACAWTLRLSPRYRLAEPIRLADHLGRQALRAPTS